MPQAIDRTGTTIGADGKRVDTADAPTDAADYRRHLIQVVGDVSGVSLSNTQPTAAATGDVWVTPSAPHTVKTYGGGAEEVQTVTVNATGGTFTVTLAGQTTSALPYNVTAGAFQTALEALSNVAAGGADLVVTGGPGATAPLTVTFQPGGAFADTNVATMTTAVGSLTGGASTAAVASPTQGSAGWA